MTSNLNLISILIYETLGTFILILFGNGSVVTELLYHADTKTGPNILSINIAYGLAVTFGIYTAHKTGGHINPVVSIVALLEGCLNFIQTIVFIFSQFLGAFLASFVLHMNYKNGFDRHLEERDYLNGICGNEKGTDSNLLAVAGAFSTFPHSSLIVDGKPKMLNMWFDQILGTFMLIFLIKMVTNKNSPHCVDAKNAPIIIGLIVIMIGQALGVNCGYAINPARDLGPRIYMLLAGFGKSVFYCENMGHYWVVPVFATVLGGVLGYYFFRILHLHLVFERERGEICVKEKDLEMAAKETLINKSN